jgi:hypothetical protein
MEGADADAATALVRMWPEYSERISIRPVRQGCERVRDESRKLGHLVI